MNEASEKGNQPQNTIKDSKSRRLEMFFEKKPMKPKIFGKNFSAKF